MDFEQVEDAILEKVRQKMDYVQTCETYAGQLEGDLDELVINCPAVFVVFNGAPLEKLDNINYNEKPTFSILLVSEDVRGNAALRKDTDTGCYRMIKDCLSALANNKLDLDIEALTPGRMYLSFITKRHACYGLTFGTDFDTQYKV